VHREGIFAVSVLAVDRVDPYNATNRMAALRADMEEVERRNPAGVLVIGSPARLAAGMYAGDGHGERCQWNFLHLSGVATWTEHTDTNSFPGQVGAQWMTNGVGDGRFDSINLKNRHWKRPVAAIDFAWPTVNKVVLTNLPITNAFYGARQFLDATEDALFRAYMLRNLARRQGSPRALQASVHGTLWNAIAVDGTNSSPPSVRQRAAAIGYSFVWDRNNVLLPRVNNTWLYSNVEPNIIQWLGVD